MDAMFAVLYKTAVARLHKLKQHTKALEIFIFLQSIGLPTNSIFEIRMVLLAPQSGQEIMSCYLSQRR
ncbi:hypothetical protein DAPPUDRAFT_274453, partial [Daphnia pulex]